MSVGGLVDAPMAADAVTFGGWDWTGNFTTIDLIAASTNALNGALLARRPDTTELHHRRDHADGAARRYRRRHDPRHPARRGPSALTNPAYITLCIGFGSVGYLLAYEEGQLFREGLFQFMTSFSLPWYAIAGAQKGSRAGIPVLGCIAARRGRPDRRPLTDRHHRAVCRRSSSSRVNGSSSIAALTGASGSLRPGPAQGRGWPPASPSCSDSRSASSRCTAAGRSRSPRSRRASTSTATAGRCSDGS